MTAPHAGVYRAGVRAESWCGSADSAKAPLPQEAPLTAPCVLLGEQVVGQRWRVGQALDGGVQEAGVTQVVQPRANSEDALPP